MITRLYTKEGWRDATNEELTIIEKVMQAKARAHSESYCFCDSNDNLFALQIQDNHFNDREDIRCVTPVYIRSKVVSISNSKPAGYYEAYGEASKPLVEIFHRIPKSS
jgi:hypothetical protein